MAKVSNRSTASKTRGGKRSLYIAPLFQGQGSQRTGGQAITGDTGLVHRVDIGCAAQRFFRTLVGFDGFGRADVGAFAAALTGVEKSAFG